ncbi:MAG: hypothetical protein U0992_23365 [Planctomycetaceae bacterium]
MACRANVEDRILAILDRARNRMSLSPRASAPLGARNTAIVAAWPLRLSTSAEPQAQAPPQKKEPVEALAGRE